MLLQGMGYICLNFRMQTLEISEQCRAVESKGHLLKVRQLVLGQVSTAVSHSCFLPLAIKGPKTDELIVDRSLQLSKFG